MTPLAERREPGCASQLELEQASAGDWVGEVKAHVERCAVCATKLQALVGLREDFVKARPTELFIARLAAKKKRTAPRAVWVGVAAAALASVLFVVSRGEGPTVNFKGSLTSFTVKRGEQQLQLHEGTTLAPGDLLRFSITAPTSGFVVVLERDGRGLVNVVAPFDATKPHPVAAGVTVLPNSAVLDEVKGREQFVTVFSAKPFELTPLLRALEHGEPVTCSGCRVEVSTFDKP